MIYYLGLIGIAAFSITGVIAAGKKDMDIFSIVLLGVVFILRASAIQWELYYPRWLIYGDRKPGAE